jgi:hypothetical protein
MSRLRKNFSRGLILAAVTAWACCGCRESRAGGEPIPHSIIVPPALEGIARALADEYGQYRPQESPWPVEVVPDTELSNALGENPGSAVMQWREPAAGDWSALAGWTGVSLVVHPDNPVRNLSSDQVRGIFTGRIARWEDAGGNPGDVHVAAYGSDSELGALFGAAVLGENRLTSSAVILPSAGALKAAVRKDPLSIGYLLGNDDAFGIRVLRIDATAAEYPNFLSQAYPFSVPIYLVAKNPAPVEIKQFAGWVQSASGQTILMELHARE